MKELYNNTPSELLNLYVDGELPASMEPHLFGQLSQNEGLQSEMRDLLSIRDAVQTDTESFTPPAAAHRGVFDYLGYTYPGGIAPVAVQTVSKFQAFVSRAWLPVLSAVVASLITTVVVNNMINQEGTKANMASKNIPVVSSYEDLSIENSTKSGATNPADADIASSNNMININMLNNSTPVAGGVNNSGSAGGVAAMESKASTTAFEPDNIAFNSYISTDNVNSDNLNSDLASINNINNSSFAGPGVKASMYSPASSGQRIYAPQSISTSPSEFGGSFLPYRAKGYRLMARFNNARSTGPGSDLPSSFDSQFSAFENISIGFLAGDGDWKLGIEVGQESFAQSFQSEDCGILYNVEQNPLIFWGAIVASYENADLKLYDIQPFIQVSAGGSELGPLGRGIIGLQYITPRAFYGAKLGLRLGFESARLWYQNQNEFNSSDRSGINFGMSLHF